MSSAEPIRQYLKDYQRPAFAIDEFHLDFDLHEDHAQVRSRFRYRKLVADAPLVLDGVGLELLQLQLDERELSAGAYEKTSESLTIKTLPDQGWIQTVVRLEPQKNTSLEGLYRSGGLFVTQCEAQGFRKITYFLDRPDVMTSYFVRVEADRARYPVLLSNGDRISTRDLENGRHEAVWKDPHKKPSYLFALVAGDLGVIRDQFETRSGRHVELEIYAAHGRQERCHHAMESLKKAMKWDEQAYGREYDLGNYMIVAIDDFNAGAMENKGLNIFNSRLVLADPQTATDADYHAIESVVGHEYFHNWTGNRVTLCNWFQLSLKEGLTVFRDQEFSADMTDRGVQRIRDVDALRERQFPEDAGPNAHPVRPESCLAVDNFFTMTIYEKGAELIRMMQTTVGRKGFRRGMDLYFERHDGQAVSTDDFAAAIAEANQADFSQLKRWYSQAGTPVVRVQEQYDQASQEYRVTLSQSCPSTPGQPEKAPFQIPIRLGFLDSSGRELPCVAPEVRVNSDGAPLLELREAERQFVFTGLREKPVLSLFREFSAPVIVDWKRDDEELLFLMSHDPDGFNRREAGQTMALRVLERLVQALKCGETPEVNWGFVKAYGQALLDERISAAEKAGLLTLPSVALFAQTQPQVDALLWRRARRTLVGALGHAHQSALWEVYRRWHGVDSTSMATEVAATRELKNQALALLASTQTSQALEVLADQYASAKTMTDRMAALALLVESDHPERERLIEAFHEQWKSDSLVLNKWFRVQASADRDGVLKRVQALMGHPSFQVQNPNHVYSLLGAFGGNILHFHDPEHCAYPFFLGWVGAIDAKNPQVAARLCSSLGLIQKLEPSLQKQAQQEIQKVLELSTLSRNTRERLEPMMKLVSRG